ncbi:hypothetical protein SAMD00023353_4300530 [Rosellinia necatrix]|uniref:Uncharacterized protein n=1 Tax=Rosellinia necatrix TaxID=77044 RepID=A0A1W2TNQ8_ROSNE|nr:hypothetical protein SAMD00023353_4300530 [Rosellinia necatrix]
MLSEPPNPSLVAGESSAAPTSQPTSSSQYDLKCLSDPGAGDAVVDIILVGDLSKPAQNTWGRETEFFWPVEIQRRIKGASIFEFSYPVDDVAAPKTRARAVEALGENISEGTLRNRSQKLEEAVHGKDSFSGKRKAPYVILVGYGYGGLLCEQVISKLGNGYSPVSGGIIGLVLFGTPHFSHGLIQWAHIVVKATAQPGARAANRGLFARRLAPSETLPNAANLARHFRSISEIQRRFFSVTREAEWDNRIASCFPKRVEGEPTILPEWNTVPHGFPVRISQSYLEMTAFRDDKEDGYQVISQLIKRWAENCIGRKGKAADIHGDLPPGKQQGIEVSGNTGLTDGTGAVQQGPGGSKST